MNDFTITDSDGKPMSIQDAYKHVNWRNSLVTLTMRTRSIDFKNIDGMQCITYMDMIAVQVEVNGTTGGEKRPVGSSVSIFGKEPEAKSSSHVKKKFKSAEFIETD